MDYRDARMVNCALALDSICPDCGANSILAAGVLHLGHFNFNGEPREGLIWTCSGQCFLSWEHRQFMGHAWAAAWPQLPEGSSACGGRSSLSRPA